MIFELRYYQKDAIESFFEYTAENWGKNPLIIVPTAGGTIYQNDRIMMSFCISLFV